MNTEFQYAAGFLPKDTPARGVGREVAPQTCLPAILQSRILGLGLSSLTRVGIGNPGVGGDDLQSCGVPQNSILALRNEPGSQALREESKRRPCVCSLHAFEDGETDEQAVAKNAQGVASVYS